MDRIWWFEWWRTVEYKCILPAAGTDHTTQLSSYCQSNQTLPSLYHSKKHATPHSSSSKTEQDADQVEPLAVVLCGRRQFKRCVLLYFFLLFHQGWRSEKLHILMTWHSKNILFLWLAETLFVMYSTFHDGKIILDTLVWCTTTTGFKPFLDG